MAMLRDVMDALGGAFPWELAVEGDNSGLQVGSPDAEVRGILCSVDMTPAVAERAESSGCDLLLTHHPLVFGSALLSVDTGTPAGSLLERAISSGLNVVACHTNVDSAEGGVADVFAGHLGLRGTAPLERAAGVSMVKVVVFVPEEALEQVSAAMVDAGAGTIGDYRHCGFRVRGTGTFIPAEGAQPYSGEVGKLNREEEFRLEMIAPSFTVRKVVEAMLENHPYQEAAYDLYSTGNPVPWGIGRVGELERERTLDNIKEELAQWCGSERPMLAGEPERRVRKVAVVPGGANALVGPAFRAGAQLLVAGEVGYHRAVEARRLGLSLLCLGHLESERCFVELMVDTLSGISARAGWNLRVDGCYDQEGPWR